MNRLNIEGYGVNFKFTHTNNQIYSKVIKFLSDGIPFKFCDDKNSGPIIIPLKLAVIDCGEVLIHSGISEFQFSLSWYLGIWEQVEQLSIDMLPYLEQKLLPYNAPANIGTTP